MLRIDSATIYQIFWLSHNGTPKTEIALRLGIARNTVSSHLTGRISHLYPASLRQRISRLEQPRFRTRPIPDGWITIADASYFFQSRPCVKTILQTYELRTEVINGARHTTKEWAREYAEKKNVANLEGVLMTADAARYFYGYRGKYRIVRLADFDPSDEPASLVHFAVGMMIWTGQNFVTLDMQDVINLVG